MATGQDSPKSSLFMLEERSPKQKLTAFQNKTHRVSTIPTSFTQ
jgi:hypothetical protein